MTRQRIVERKNQTIHLFSLTAENLEDLDDHTKFRNSFRQHFLLVTEWD